MKILNVVKFAIVLLLFFSVQSFGYIVTPTISGYSSATAITEGEYEGFYLYQIDVVWDFGSDYAGLSHWDLILNEGCKLTDHLIEFDNPSSFATSEQFSFDPDAMSWSGYFERNGDPSLILESGPVIKYDSPFLSGSAEAGAIGYGTFFFYSNIEPIFGIHPDVLVGKAGHLPDIYGDLSGAYPSCTVTPEPTTVCMLSMGGGLLLMMKK